MSSLRSKLFSLCFCFSAIAVSTQTHAQNAVDHRVPLNRDGIFRAQDAVPVALGLISLTGALVEGSESRLGKTFWKSSESIVISEILAQGLKRVTRRRTPTMTDNPNSWFKNGGDSFPSGHVTFTTAAVTPFILEYKDEYPMVLALAVLPAYEMIARVKGRHHWQSDVIAGAALGAAVGWYEHGKNKPWVVSVLPGGVFVGYNKTLP